MKIRFTILNLLWVTFVAALAAGWWADHRAMQKRVESVGAKWKELVFNCRTKTSRENTF